MSVQMSANDKKLQEEYSVLGEAEKKPRTWNDPRRVLGGGRCWVRLGRTDEPYAKGTTVMTRIGGTWHHATIVRVYKDHTYDLSYDDGVVRRVSPQSFHHDGPLCKNYAEDGSYKCRRHRESLLDPDIVQHIMNLRRLKAEKRAAKALTVSKRRIDDDTYQSRLSALMEESPSIVTPSPSPSPSPPPSPSPSPSPSHSPSPPPPSLAIHTSEGKKAMTLRKKAVRLVDYMSGHPEERAAIGARLRREYDVVMFAHLCIYGPPDGRSLEETLFLPPTTRGTGEDVYQTFAADVMGFEPRTARALDFIRIFRGDLLWNLKGVNLLADTGVVKDKDRLTQFASRAYLLLNIPPEDVPSCSAELFKALQKGKAKTYQLIGNEDDAMACLLQNSNGLVKRMQSAVQTFGVDMSAQHDGSLRDIRFILRQCKIDIVLQEGTIIPGPDADDMRYILKLFAWHYNSHVAGVKSAKPPSKKTSVTPTKAPALEQAHVETKTKARQQAGSKAQARERTGAKAQAQEKAQEHAQAETRERTGAKAQAKKARERAEAKSQSSREALDVHGLIKPSEDEQTASEHLSDALRGQTDLSYMQMFRVHDLKTLNDGNEVNELIIEEYVKAILEDDARSGMLQADVYSNMDPRLSNASAKAADDNMRLAYIKRLRTRHRHLDKHIIFVIINSGGGSGSNVPGGGHWLLGVLLPKMTTPMVLFFDPMAEPNTNSQAKRVMKNLTWLAQAMFNDERRWAQRDVSVPVQVDDYNCGVYLCMAMDLMRRRTYTGYQEWRASVQRLRGKADAYRIKMRGRLMTRIERSAYEAVVHITAEQRNEAATMRKQRDTISFASLPNNSMRSLLYAKEWLDDKVVKEFSTFLSDDDATKDTRYIDPAVFALVDPSLTGAGSDRGQHDILKAARQHLLPMFAERHLDSLNQVLIPIRHHTQHWVLIILRPRAGEILFFDPLKNGSNALASRVFRVVITAMSVLHHRGVGEWQKVDISVDIQKDGYNCGVYVCMVMDLLRRGRLVGAVHMLAGKADAYRANIASALHRMFSSPRARALVHM